MNYAQIICATVMCSCFHVASVGAVSSKQRMRVKLLLLADDVIAQRRTGGLRTLADAAVDDELARLKREQSITAKAVCSALRTLARSTVRYSGPEKVRCDDGIAYSELGPLHPRIIETIRRTVVDHQFLDRAYYQLQDRIEGGGLKALINTIAEMLGLERRYTVLTDDQKAAQAPLKRLVGAAVQRRIRVMREPPQGLGCCAGAGDRVHKARAKNKGNVLGL